MYAQIPFRLEALGYDEVGSKTGWLVAAYAGGLIVSSPPIAYIGGRIRGKQIPLIIALLAMAGGILMFMFTESYTALVISRVLQGISGTGIWTLGLAMIVDSVPEARIGVVMVSEGPTIIVILPAHVDCSCRAGS